MLDFFTTLKLVFKRQYIFYGTKEKTPKILQFKFDLNKIYT